MYWSKLLVADELLKESPEESTGTRKDVAGSCTERAWKTQNNLRQRASKFYNGNNTWHCQLHCHLNNKMMKEDTMAKGNIQDSHPRAHETQLSSFMR